MMTSFNFRASRRAPGGYGSRAAACLWVMSVFSCCCTAKILDTLIIEGLVVNQPAVVHNSAGLEQGGEFTGADIQQAIQNLYRLGLFGAIDFYTANETDTSATLLLRVRELPVCDAVEFSGNKKIKLKELEDALRIRTGQVITDEDLLENTRAIQKLYRDKGYLLAGIEPELIETKVPGYAILKIVIKENRKVRIRDITFEGNEEFSDRRLRLKFKTKESRWWRSGEYDDDIYQEHLDSLIYMYNNKGYLDARIVRDSVRIADNERDIFIRIAIEEGKKFFTGDFYFTGNNVVETDSLKNRIALREGKPFRKDKFDLSRYMIEDAYREVGYLWVKVQDSKAYRGDTIDVTFDITEGRAAIVRKVMVEGNTKTMEKVVRREITVMPSQKYRQSRMARSVREIMQLNYFDNVSPDLKPNEDGTIDLVFRVTEKDNIGQLSIGAAYSERDKFVGTFSTTIPNFRGAGQELTLKVEYGKYRQNYAIGFKEPWAFNRPIALTGSIYYELTEYQGTTESYGFRIGAGRRLTWPDDYFRIDGMYQLSREDEWEATRRRGEGGYIVLPSEGTMSRLSLTLRRNDTDLPNFPTRGSIFYLTPEIAGLGGSYKYFKTTVGYDWYFPLVWKFVLGSKTKFGLVTRFPGEDEIVITKWDLLSAGGVYSAGTIRGYPDYTFGGYRAPERGITMLVQSAMIQFPIMEQQLYLSGFFDMGNTWADISDVSLVDLYKGVGVGLRILVPMLGLMGFDFAWKLDDPNRQPSDSRPVSDRFEFHFLMNRGF